MKSILIRLFACSVVMSLLLVGTPVVSQTEDPLTSADATKIENIQSSISTSEWLGPLAPIAISPFFGLTILAGLSQFGGDWVDNSFISDNPVLSNPAVFWVFLVLTIMTSLPRISKVSKPAGQAIDQLEAYAGIVTLVLIRFMTSMDDSGSVEVANQATMVVEMGGLAMGADVLLSLAAFINIFVINTVKFFFEVLVWLIPFPSVDAALEVANKSVCAGLMAIYAWSPTVATILNLILFFCCLIAFRWINRRVTYMRSVMSDPIWSLARRAHGVPTKKELVVFPQSGIAGFPAKTKLLLQPTDDGWKLTQSRWIFQPKAVQLLKSEHEMEMQSGVLLNSINVTGEQSDKLLFSKRYARHLSELAKLINVRESSAKLEVDLRTELA